MSAYIHHIATANPAFTYSQDYTRDRLKEWAVDPKTKRLIHAIYNRSGIETRHSVTGDFVKGSEAGLFISDAAGRLIPPGTAERNRVYTEGARKLAVDVSRRAIDGAAGFEKEDITHIIYTSCTGFANPGPDYHVIRELGLRENVQRYTLGFMGCYAAFPALRMAAQFCEADPKAVVLVICLELCTLHMQINDEHDSILANSLFLTEQRQPLSAPGLRRTGSQSMSCAGLNLHWFRAANRKWPGRSAMKGSTLYFPAMCRTSSAETSASYWMAF